MVSYGNRQEPANNDQGKPVSNKSSNHANIIAKISMMMLMVFCVSPLQAQVNNDTEPVFSPQKANEVYDRLAIKLSTQNLNANELESAITKLTQLRDKARYCVNYNQNRLTKINNQLEKVKDASQNKTTVQTYLTEKQNKFQKEMNECRFFLLRANDAIKAYQTALDRLTTKRLFTKNPPFWQDLSNADSLINKAVANNTAFDIRRASGLSIFSWPPALGLVLIIALATVISRYLRKRLAPYPRHHSHVAVQALLSSLDAYMSRIVITATICLYLYSLNSSSVTLLTILSAVVACYYLLMWPIKALIAPPIPSEGLFPLSPKLRQSSLSKLRVLVLLSLLGALGYGVTALLQLPAGIIRIAFTIWATLLSGHLLLIIWHSAYIWKLKIKQSWPTAVSYLINLLILFNIVLIWSGYYNLSYFALKGLVESALALIIALVLAETARRLLAILNGKSRVWQQKLRYYLGIKPHKNINELLWIYIAALVVIWSGFAIIMLLIWGLSNSQYYALMEYLTEGFTVGDLTLDPLRIILAVVLFGLLGLASRWISTTIGHKSGLYAKRGESQIELASITLYICYSFSLLIALLIAGVNFTGLAIIAGALSIGIGFGLQNIINNVVSGIILLLERPIRPGDRIIIGQTEGFVKRIRIRATQVMTLERSDVIIPNSELIANQVINLMFRDQRWRITCQVGVAYGSNTELVREVLTNVAHRHPDVIDDPPDAPKVLFKAFGDSSLEFELWCIVRDVNKKYNILSDLNFEIDKAFRQNGITIAFPQRDIHIKDTVERGN